MTGTRPHEVEILEGCALCISKDKVLAAVPSVLTSSVSSVPPKIFRVSHSIFSSPEIYGTTLSMISKLEIPGYPAPEIACMAMAIHGSIGPKRFFEGGKWDNEPGGRTVGIRDDETVLERGGVERPLLRDYRVVHERDGQRDL
jgi:hypothetical protein